MASELQKLIKDQLADNASDFVDYNKPRPDRAIAVDPAKLIGLSDDIQAKKDSQGKITWGKPAQICQAKNDRRCNCGETTKKVAYEQTRLLSGLEFNTGSCLCGKCGFAF